MLVINYSTLNEFSFTIAICNDLNINNGVIAYSPMTSYIIVSMLCFSLPLAACDDLGNITNGVIMYSTASSPRLQDTVATYSCTMKLELFGAETRTCQNNRFWSGMEPYCQR